jgi:hypothetical protein
MTRDGTPMPCWRYGLFYFHFRVFVVCLLPLTSADCRARGFLRNASFIVANSTILIQEHVFAIIAQ